MNREIKFRAWDKSRQEMYDPHTLHFDPITKSFGSIRFHGDFMCDSILMRYTGLELNGEELYEGDILKFTLEDGTIEYGLIRFSEEGFWTSQAEGFSEELLSDELNSNLDIELLGSIYQNPKIKAIIDAKELGFFR